MALLTSIFFTLAPSFLTLSHSFMAFTPIPYSQFLAQDSILSTSGGPWHCSGFANRSCIAQNAWFTSNQTSISSYLQAKDPSADYTMSLQASILVDLTSFGSRNQLSYNWSFFATSLSDQPSGTQQFKSNFGNGTYVDFIPVQDIKNNETWANASYFHHTGDTILQGDGTNRTLDLYLELTISHEPSEFVGLILRNLHLVLGSSTDTYTTVASPTISDVANTSVPPPDPSTLPIATSSPTASPGLRINSWIIACAVASGIFLILLAILAVVLWKRRKRLRRISLSKVKNVKRPDLLLTDDLPMDVINITGQDPSVITPFHPSPEPHSIRRSKPPPTSTGPQRERRRREKGLHPPPPYPESPPLPQVTEEQFGAIPIRLTSRQRRSNLHDSVL